MAYYIGIDLGGTNIKAGLLDDQGQTRHQTLIPTQADQGADHVIDRMAQLARQLVDETEDVTMDDIAAIGVGTPGPLDPKTGIVLSAPNLPGWDHIPLGDQLAQKTQKRVAVVNDANAAAYAEFWAGAAKAPEIKNIVLLTLGTGVGGGVVIDGHLFEGAYGAGAELGHMIVHKDGRLCGCGQHGCLEPYASAISLVREAHERAVAAPKGSTALHADSSCQDIFDLAEKGIHEINDPLANEVLNESIDYLALGCINCARTFDPQMILIGGGMVGAGDQLLEHLTRRFNDLSWNLPAAGELKIALATLGNRAGLIGAAGMAKALLDEKK